MKISKFLARAIVSVCTLMMFSVFCGTHVQAQEWGPFSNNGMRGFADSLKRATPTIEKPDWGNMFKKPAFNMPKPQKINWPKLGLFKNMESNMTPSQPPSFLEGIPNVFSNSENRPGAFFQDMSDRSRSFFNRTTNGISDWAAQTNQNARNRTAETLENLRGGLMNPLKRQTSPPSVQPPVRTANNYGSQTKVKF